MKPKRLYVVGIGPGNPLYLTEQARLALEEAELLCGYTVYIELIRAQYPDKELLTTPMRQEIARCKAALDAADSGKITAMVCSGDAGVYGMAAPILELSKEYPQVEVIVVAGVTAALSGAAVLGAPLTHDFAVISLSDLLTPWEKIEKRLLLAAEADFSLVLYNPSSKKRADYLKRAVDCILQHRAPDTVCGVVRQIGREGQQKTLLTLGELRDYEADMFTTVFVGNSQTIRQGDFMITPRGYAITP